MYNRGGEGLMKKQVKIFLFCDAFGYEIAQKYHFMEDKLPFRYPAETQLGYSSTAVPTILCGEPPTVHGHFSCFYYDREGKSPFKCFNKLQYLMHPRVVFDHHRMRHKISQFIQKWFGWTGYFNLYHLPLDRLGYFDYCEKFDIYAPNALRPAENIRDMLDACGVKYHISNWRRPDKENLDEAEVLLARGDIDFLFIYTGEIDRMLHFHVHEPDYVQARLDELQLRIEKLLEIAGEHYANVAFYMMSDHGMTPLSGSVDLKSEFERPPYRFGHDFIAVYDSTMLRLWILNPAAREPLMRRLDSAPGHWLSEEEKKTLHIDFADHKYGDEIFLLDPGVQLAPSDMGAKAIPGMHGYSPYDKDSTASLLANVEPPLIPKTIADFFRLMKTEAARVNNRPGKSA